MRKGILCFLKKEQQVLLIKVDYGSEGIFWNGISGYIEEGESSEDAVIREVEEEIGVVIDKNFLEKRGNAKGVELEVFVVTKWEGTPELKENSIKDLKWFHVENLPFEQMFPKNQDWLSDLIR